MEKNIIVITNLCDGNKAIEVENFSDENVKTAISKLISVAKSNLQCEASSMGGGLYRIKRIYSYLKDAINSQFAGELILDVKYCKLVV